MDNQSKYKEEFTFTFDGEAFSKHEVSALQLSQSLVGLNTLLTRCALLEYLESKMNE